MVHECYGNVNEVNIAVTKARTIDYCAKDGRKELFTKMHCVLSSNSYRIFKDS